MIDWLTLSIPARHLGASDRLRIEAAGRALTCVHVGTGEVDWRGTARSRLTHPTGGHPTLEWRIANRTTGLQVPRPELWVSGSPAKLRGLNNLFGHRDVRAAALEVIDHLDQALVTHLPRDLFLWNCTRVDVALNYLLDSRDRVEEALSVLARAHVSQPGVSTVGSTIYFGRGSEWLSGRCYAKGPHLQHIGLGGVPIGAYEDLSLAMRVLRAELTLASKFWKRSERHWSSWTVEQLEAENLRFFAERIGGLEISDMSDLETRLREVAPTPGLANAAYCTWLQILAKGYRAVADAMPDSTLRRHCALLKGAGLSEADIRSAQVVPLRRREIYLGGPIHSFEELRRAA